MGATRIRVLALGFASPCLCLEFYFLSVVQHTGKYRRTRDVLHVGYGDQQNGLRERSEEALWLVFTILSTSSLDQTSSIIIVLQPKTFIHIRLLLLQTAAYLSRNSFLILQLQSGS